MRGGDVAVQRLTWGKLSRVGRRGLAGVGGTASHLDGLIDVFRGGEEGIGERLADVQLSCAAGVGGARAENGTTLPVTSCGSKEYQVARHHRCERHQ